MTYNASLFLDHLGFFDPDLQGLAVHGANIVSATLVRRLCTSSEVGTLEVFLPPQIMQPELLKRAAEAVLPPERRGRGALAFYPAHAVGDVWADGGERVLVCVDPEGIATARYLRDRFAVGATPILCDTHALGFHRLWGAMRPYARAARVPFDSMACISTAYREAMRKALTGFLGDDRPEPPCRLDLLPHGVDITLFRAHSEEGARQAREALSLPADGTIALFQGRVTPQCKAELFTLLRAFARASSRPDHYLLIAGQEEMPGYMEALRGMAQALGIGERLLLRPQIPIAKRHLPYAAADLFVFPGDTVQEAQGTTVVEAMASGLPCILSDWDGLRDMVSDGWDGFITPAWWMPALERVGALSPVTPMRSEFHYAAQCVWVDPVALADRLARLLHAPDLRRGMGAAARRRMEEEYSLERVAARWHSLCHELLSLARQESPAEAERRRAGADELGLPTPYMYLFDHYATGVLDSDWHAARLSDTGREVAAGARRLEFYDEALPLLRPETVQALLATLAGAAGWQPLGDIVADAERRSGRPADDVRFCLALLMKAGHVEVRTAAP